MSEEKKLGKFYVERIVYQKDGKERSFCLLKVDLPFGYKSFMPKYQSDLAEILDIKVSELHTLEVGKKYYIN